jgi:hypothetical protein
MLPRAMYYLLGLVASIALFAAYVASRPSAFRIERSRTISARPDVLFGLINDFHEWAQWSPWEKLDPNLKRTFEGPSSGKGAVYRWEGNGKAGVGSMTITETTPSRIDIALDFLKPFPANNRAIFTLEPDGEGTKVTWAMEGESPFPAKVFGVFVNMNDLVGKDFAKGLDAMQETAARKA